MIMKYIYTIIVFCFATVQSFSQISPSLKAGVGYSYVLDKDESIAPDVHTITGYPTLSVEKPFPIEIRLKKRLSINPGLAYYFFKEVKESYNPKYSVDYKYNHQSVNGFIKVLYQAKIRGKTEAFIYGGGIGGINLITKTKGARTVYGLNVEIPEYNVIVNENASDFFEMFYYGVVIGFQPNARKYNFIKPSFEIVYYPGFVSKTKETIPITYADINMIQFTLYLGFRIK
jgi:hypothetical protein